jgi:hypothetical protein
MPRLFREQAQHLAHGIAVGLWHLLVLQQTENFRDLWFTGEQGGNLTGQEACRGQQLVSSYLFEFQGLRQLFHRIPRRRARAALQPAYIGMVKASALGELAL